VRALVRWCVFAVATGRRPRLDVAADQYFDVADDPGASYADKLDAYRELADGYFETERYQDFCATRLAHMDELVLDWAAGPGFDDLLVQTVRSVYPAHEHDQFIAHLRGLTAMWVRDEDARLRGTA